MIAVGDKEKIGDVELQVVEVVSQGMGNYSVSVRAEFNINGTTIIRHHSKIPDRIWQNKTGRRNIAYDMARQAVIDAYKIDS